MYMIIYHSRTVRSFLLPSLHVQLARPADINQIHSCIALFFNTIIRLHSVMCQKWTLQQGLARPHNHGLGVGTTGADGSLTSTSWMPSSYSEARTARL